MPTKVDRWCLRCKKPMRRYRDIATPGLCRSCFLTAAGQRLRRESQVFDESEATIEARFQAALKEVKRTRPFEVESTRGCTLSWS